MLPYTSTSSRPFYGGCGSIQCLVIFQKIKTALNKKNYTTFIDLPKGISERNMRIAIMCHLPRGDKKNSLLIIFLFASMVIRSPLRLKIRQISFFFSSHNIYSALLERIEHCYTRKSTCRLPIYLCIYILYVCIYFNLTVFFFLPF